MYIGGLDIHLDWCCLDIFSDLEKDVFFGTDVQAGRKSAAVIILPGTWAILK